MLRQEAHSKPAVVLREVLRPAASKGQRRPALQDAAALAAVVLAVTEQALTPLQSSALHLAARQYLLTHIIAQLRQMVLH
jgi:hypothetical protein